MIGIPRAYDDRVSRLHELFRKGETDTRTTSSDENGMAGLFHWILL
jgi:hypothetical protein